MTKETAEHIVRTYYAKGLNMWFMRLMDKVFGKCPIFDKAEHVLWCEDKNCPYHEIRLQDL